ncbi:MAG TPA: formyltransferase family protein [Streptosporangiaceae bacterium]|nr:formyltransferase family protein [Streptosporangiaceae bacterium]
MLASGSGSILRSIIEHGPPVALVVTDRPCPALDVASTAGVPAIEIGRRDFGYRPRVDWDRRGFTLAVDAALEAAGIDLVAMAGFFTILHEVIFEHYSGRVLNIHPALLPAFKGAHAVRDTLAAGVPVTGPTIHVATEVLDDERHILAQSASVPVLAGDDVDTLWERIKAEERRLYPQVLWKIVNGDIELRK